jgi:hypothetical protein
LEKFWEIWRLLKAAGDRQTGGRTRRDFIGRVILERSWILDFGFTCYDTPLLYCPSLVSGKFSLWKMGFGILDLGICIYKFNGVEKYRGSLL